MRFKLRLAIWARWKRDRLRSQTQRSGCVWKGLRSPWCWWAVLVLLGLLIRPASSPVPTALPSAVHGGTGLLVLLAPATSAVSHAARAASDCGVTDLTSCINDWINSFAKNTIAAWFQQQASIFTSYGFIFQTPDSLTYHAQPVQEFYRFSLGVVGVLLTFILAIAGYNHMTGRSTAWAEMLSHILMCGVMAFAFQPFIAMFLQLSNDFIFGMQFAVGLQPTFPAYGAASDAFMDIIALIFELLGDLLLALEALARLALLDLLIALAPLGILCYALPQTRGWGRLWAEAFAATILIQPIQASLIMLGAKMISMLGLFLQASLPPIVQIFVGIASLTLALRVPTMLLSRATHVVADFQREIAMIGASMAARAA